MKIENYTTTELTIDRFHAAPGQAWCILGRNRSGIDLFFDLISGSREDTADCVTRPPNCGIISFERQQALFENELKKDETDFLDRIDPGTPARAFLNNPSAHMDLIRALNMDRVLHQGYRQLSTGQSRKLLLLSQITRGRQCIIIQAPYEGLDVDGCRELNRALALCLTQGIQLLVTVHNTDDIPDWATHIGVLDRGKFTLSGPKQEVMDSLSRRMAQEQADFRASVAELEERPSPGTTPASRELVRLEDGTAGYQGRDIFKGLDLTVRTGDHTLVTGPNGCGKSTLLHLITGDHPACYKNRLWIFGHRRGTGESIWDLKQRMGIVSPDLHRNYIVPGSTLDCVLSGIYDSIGLYTSPTAADRAKALAWLERIDLAGEAGTPFRRLSYADQRLALIARALIKLPELLILDEPTQGLDRANREAVLEFLGQVAGADLSTILYVSHREDEFKPFFARRLDMTQFIAGAPGAL
ncbi:MAG TPA: ABC transporter [Desulfobacteraceae bacterium]|nr:ABC transporter [Desulfobacteraceae bacterium]